MRICDLVASWAQRNKVGEIIGRIPIDDASARISEPGNLSAMMDMHAPVSSGIAPTNRSALLASVPISPKSLGTLTGPVWAIAFFFNYSPPWVFVTLFAPGTPQPCPGQSPHRLQHIAQTNPPTDTPQL